MKLSNLIFVLTLMVGIPSLAKTTVPPAPSSMTSALAAGTVDPGTQLLWHTQLLVDCTTLSTNMQPGQRDSYPTAKQKYSKAVCYMAGCMQRALALDYLAQSSPNPANGGSTNVQVQQSNLNTYNTIMAQVAATDCDVAAANASGTTY